jgi:hypothetical protein
MIHSVFIQGADTYLHLATEAVETLQINIENPNSHLYSRGLAPWCTARPTFGNENNPNFWGCGLTATHHFGVSNLSSVTALSMRVSEHHDVSDFVDKDGLSLAVLMPKGVEPGINWSATSFAVSTQCHAIRNNSCEFSVTSDVVTGHKYPFNCSSTEPEFRTSDVMYSVSQQRRYHNWHQYVTEPSPFRLSIPSWKSIHGWQKLARNLLYIIIRESLEAADTIKSDNDRFIFSEQDAILSYCNHTGSCKAQRKSRRR